MSKTQSPTPRTTRRPSGAPPADPSPDRAASSPTVGTMPETDPEVSRLSLPLTPDGRVDSTRLRERTKDALRKVLSDPKLSESLGVLSPAANEDAAIIAQISNGLYDGVSALSIALARRAGYPIEQAAILMFTSAEKEQLEPATGRVVNKWLPALSGKYRDEILLAFAVTNIMAAKVMLLRGGITDASSRTVAPETELPKVS